MCASGGTLSITGGSIAGSGLDGLYVPSALTSLTISGTRIVDNGDDGIDYNGSAAAWMHYGRLYGNGGLGIRNRNANVCFDAAYNYWGDEAGPDDPDAADDGCMGPIAHHPAGEGVSQDVDYYPWQDERGDVVPLLAVRKSAEDVDGGRLSVGDVVRYTIHVTNVHSITVTGATFTAAAILPAIGDASLAARRAFVRTASAAQKRLKPPQGRRACHLTKAALCCTIQRAHRGHCCRRHHHVVPASAWAESTFGERTHATRPWTGAAEWLPD